jgi:iron complex transport system ATP-binding protein
LVQEPKLLLLDEPTTHLDLSNKGHILATLSTLAARGVTVIFTTHDPEAAASTAAYLVLIREGKVLSSGSLDHVLTAEKLSQTYGIRVRVVQVDGHSVVLLNNHNR